MTRLAPLLLAVLLATGTEALILYVFGLAEGYKMLSGMFVVLSTMYLTSPDEDRAGKTRLVPPLRVQMYLAVVVGVLALGLVVRLMAAG